MAIGVKFVDVIPSSVENAVKVILGEDGSSVGHEVRIKVLKNKTAQIS